MKMKNIAVAALVVFASVSLWGGPNAAHAETEYKVGIVAFLSGGVAGPFGIPARNAAEIVIENINAGKLPPPYDSVGLAGVPIKPVFIDENSKQKIADYQKLVEKDKVNAVVGYLSSGSCKAIAPEAEKLKQLTLFTICGTPQIFENIVTSPKYLFRMSSHATMDNVGAARYILSQNSNVKSIAGINQNYAWGQDSWRDFSETMMKLKPGIKITTEQFPKIFAGQYGSEISALLTNKSDVVHSSFWGGDLEAFIIQGGGRGLFGKSTVILTAGDTAIQRLGPQIPDGAIIGTRGPNGQLAPKSALNDWFRKTYFDRYGSYPVQPSYLMAQALMGLKAAADKAGSTDNDAIRKALTGLSFVAAGGEVNMALSNGHQATTDTAYGTYKFDREKGRGTLTNIVRFKSSCVNPPEGVKSVDWITGGFKGAVCD